MRRKSVADVQVRPGGVAVWLLVSLGVILGIVALGMDGGRLMEQRRRAQNAADAAALAAAALLYRNNNDEQGLDPRGTARQAALNSALANGYRNDGSTSAITINIPPKSGAFAGKATHVEVVLTAWIKGSFSTLFTQEPLKVQARCVARGKPKDVGLLLLQEAGDGALSIKGNASINLLDGAIAINSSAQLALIVSGNGTLLAAFIDLAASTVTTGSGVQSTINTDVPPTPDPLADLPAPNPADYPLEAGSSTSISFGLATLNPGVYEGGLHIGGTAMVRLNPGIYIMDGGGFSISGNASVFGKQVMIYNTGGSAAGPISITGNGVINLTPPTDGIYTGISIFQDRGLTTDMTLRGNATLSLTGTIYAPSAGMSLSGNVGTSLASLGSGYILNNLSVSGNGSFNIGHGSSRPRIPDIRMVE